MIFPVRNLNFSTTHFSTSINCGTKKLQGRYLKNEKESFETTRKSCCPPALPLILYYSKPAKVVWEIKIFDLVRLRKSSQDPLFSALFRTRSAKHRDSTTVIVSLAFRTLSRTFRTLRKRKTIFLTRHFRPLHASAIS